jgi:biotin carboxyl carrier protein
MCERIPDPVDFYSCTNHILLKDWEANSARYSSNSTDSSSSLILDIKVTPGDVVKKGDVVIILEAMKMENSIKSPGDGVVKDIKVVLKQSVEKNQVLIHF